MDRNLLLAFALSFLVLSLWTMTQEPKHPPAPAEQAAEQAAEPAGPQAQAETAAPGAAGRQTAGGREEASQRYPELGKPSRSTAEAGPPLRESAQAEEAGEAGSSEEVQIERPRYQATLDSRGACIRRWKLNDFQDHDGDPIELVWRDEPSPAAVTPFVELGHGDLSRAVWTVARSDADGVVFTLARDGLHLRKTYRFEDTGYGFRLRIDVDNAGKTAVAPAFLVEWPIAQRGGNDFRQQSLAALYEGSLKTKPLGSLGSAGILGFFKGTKGDEPTVYRGEVDWAGVETPYFLAALFPDQPEVANARFVPIEKHERGVAQLYFDPVELQAGQHATREFRGYAGPKEVARLEAFAPSAVGSINLGWSWVSPLTRGFTWLLHAIYTFIPNYGVAIILLTLMVRLVTAPLTIRQMRSMERMRRIQPKMKEIQEKFADDRQKQSEEMMRLYRQEKVNPLGGCLPMVLQLPVFVGLFYALRSSIDLRQAPFFLWIDDLSAPDQLFTLPGLGFPVRLLPLVMGVSMFAQQKMTPMQADPTQARMMATIMPVMMTFVSYTFPSGLVLYWMMSNFLAIGHQLWIGRKMGPPAKAAPAKTASAKGGNQEKAAQ